MPADGHVGGHALWHLVAVGFVPVVVIIAFKFYDSARYQRMAPASSRTPSDTDVVVQGLPRPSPSRSRLSEERLPGGHRQWHDRRYLCAWASASAAAIHAKVGPAHFVEDSLFGAFFLSLCIMQLGWGVLVLRYFAPSLFRLGAAFNAGVVMLWVYSRTVGLPFGPDPGRPEEVGVLDVVATALELVVVILALRLAAAQIRRPYKLAAE